MPEPIDLYYWPTPTGKKITIFLEEAELPYNVAPVDRSSNLHTPAKNPPSVS